MENPWGFGGFRVGEEAPGGVNREKKRQKNLKNRRNRKN